MLIDGKPSLRVTCQLLPFTVVTVPGFVLPDVNSCCVATSISPTAGIDGFCGRGNVTLFPYRAFNTPGRLTTPASTRTSTSGYTIFQGALEAWFCQFPGLVAIKKVRNSLVARSLLLGTVMPLINVIELPRSSPAVFGLSTMTAPNM